MIIRIIQKNEKVYMPVNAEAASVRFRLDDGRTAWDGHAHFLKRTS
jgi:hypothetical protein